jgi:P4 family phage/plasmid primase-like protien
MAMTKPFQELLERLGYVEDDSVTVCYQSATQGFRVKQVKVSFADTVVEALTEMKANVWYEINPSNVSGRATANDITRLAAVWVDIDYKETGIQSEGNASQLVDLLAELIGVAPSAVVHSGHGLQPYWAIDPEEEYTQEQAAGVLARWGAFVRYMAASQGGQLDSVFDLPRIFRAVGGVNYKDVANPVPVRVDLPEQWRPISLAELDDVLITHGFTSVHTMPEEFTRISGSSEWEYVAEDCHWVTHLFQSVAPTNGAPKSRHGWLVQQLIKVNAAHRNGCLTELSAHKLVTILDERFRMFLKDAPAREMNKGELESANRWAVARVESFSLAKLKEEVRGHQHNAASSGGDMGLELEAVADDGRANLMEVYQQSIDVLGFNDASNSFRLNYWMQGGYRHVTDVGWHYWDGSRYVIDKDKSIIQTAIDALQPAKALELGKEGFRWIESSQNKERLNNAITISATSPEILISAIDLDAEANSICTPDGIVNLLTGELRPAIKGVDLNTRQTSVTPRQAHTPLWDTFLRETIEDAERIAYVQELFGASLFGDSRFHVLPVFVGTGANGKSTIIDVIAGILNDYAATMPENFLLDTTGNAHPADIARLRGVRLAVASETRPDGKFNESRVKMLTGGDTLSARFMGQNFFDFKPTHTLFMAVNHLPEVKSGGDGFWRRLRKIDFNKTIPADKRKENLAKTLVEEEGAGILQWMIDGAVRVTNQGFSEPESVKMATQSYRHEEDHIAKFLDEKTILADTATVAKVSLYNAYREWCAENGEKPVTQNSLSREVKGRLGVAESTSAGYKMFSGVELLKVDATNNKSSIKDILGYIDSEDKDEYWKR